MALVWLVVSFAATLVIGFPIAFALLFSSIIYIFVSGYPMIVISNSMFAGINSFPLLAVPFFVFTGQLMLKGRLLRSMVEFINTLIGHIRGALAMVNIVASLFLGSIIGLAVADAASLGSFLIPTMKEEGYTAEFASAVTASSSLLGPIMPPSVLMILYAIAVGRTSIAGMFLAALIPAFLTTLAQVLVAFFKGKKENFPKYKKSTGIEKWNSFKESILALLLPIIILGTIFGRVCSVTEASAIAALYALIVSSLVYKEVKLKDLPDMIIETALTSGLVMILVGCASITAYAIANEQVYTLIAGPLSQLPVWGFLLIVNIILLINGFFMDDYASVVILGPIIAKIAWQFGIDPIQIGIIICMNLVIGLATPPFGICLFVTSPIAGVTLEQTVKEIIPFILVSIGILLLVTFIPQITLYLPRLFGY